MLMSSVDEVEVTNFIREKGLHGPEVNTQLCFKLEILVTFLFLGGLPKGGTVH